MAEIYKSAILTIAATRARSGLRGFLSPQDFSKRELLPHVSICGSIDQEHRCWKYAFKSEAAASNPLLQRGWFFQERLLSTRVLHYAANEMVWECKSCTLCECGLTDFGESAFKRDAHQSLKWNDIVRLYTSADLTRSSDILEALSGVASNFEAGVKGRYLAGLWRKDLPAGLLWSSDGAAHRPPSYTAPSFSWASRIGPVGFFAGHIYPVEDVRFHLSILEAWCETNDLNSFGAVSNGSLLVRGVLLRAEKSDSIGLELVPIRTDIAPSAQNAKDEIAAGFLLPDTDEWRDEVKGTSRYCLPVFTAYRKNSSAIQAKTLLERKFDWSWCLVLIEQAGVFRRIGIANIKGLRDWQGYAEERVIEII